MNTRNAHLLIPLVVMSASAFAETTPAAPADHTAVLKQLIDCGVSDVSGAKWMSLRSYTVSLIMHNHPVNLDGGSREVRTVFGPAADHLWIFPSNGDALPSIMIPGIADAQSPEASRVSIGTSGKRAGERKGVTTSFQEVTAAKLAEDIDDIIGRVEERFAKRRRVSGGARDTYMEGIDTKISARLLVFAAQVYRAGDSSSANRLAEAALKCAPDRDLALATAIGSIADSRYLAACDAFEKDGDWARYAKSLKELQTKFTRGWENRSAVAKVLALVEKRVAGGVPPIAMPAGVTGDAHTIAAFEALGAMKSPSPAPDAVAGADFGESLKLLPPLPGKSGAQPFGISFGGNRETMNASEVSALTKSGVAALPVLLAAIGDETPIALFRAGHGSYFPGSGESPEVKKIRLYGELYRPLTRGEIARSLIEESLPGEETKSRSLDDEALSEAVDKFYAGHAKDSPVELCTHYWKEGSSRQKQVALRYLSQSDDPTAGKVFEETLLGAADIEGRLGDALTYLRVKRSTTSGFAKKLAVALKARLALPDARPKQENMLQITNGGVRVSKVRLQAVINEVEAYASGKTAREIILEAVAKSAKEAMPILNMQAPILMKTPFAERVSLLLEAACIAQDAPVKSWCVSQLGMFSGFGDSKAKYSVPAPGSTEAKRWLELLGDEKTKISPAHTVAKSAAQALEKLCEAPPAYAQVDQRTPANPADDIFRRRAMARLEGREIPAYPDPAKVSEARLTQILATAATTPDEKLKGYVDGLIPEEHIAWNIWWSQSFPYMATTSVKVTLPRVAPPRAVMDRLKRLSSIATWAPEIPLTEADKAYSKEVFGEAGLALGDVVDRARTVALCDFLAKDAGKYSGSMFEVTRVKNAFGLSVYAHREKIAPVDTVFPNFKPIAKERVAAVQLHNLAQRLTHDADNGFNGSDAVVILQINIPGAQKERIWRIKDGKVVAPAPLDEKEARMIARDTRILVLTAKDAGVILSGAQSSPNYKDVFSAGQ